TKNRLEITKRTGEPVLIANAENEFAEAKKARDALEIFKKDLGSFTRFYEFMSQIVEYDDKELEKISLFARNLRPLLREQAADEDVIDLSNVAMSHYRLSKIRQQDIQLKANSTEHKLEPANDLGTAKPKNKNEEFLSVILQRVNEVFITDKLTDQDMINYVYTVADKMSENTKMMKQIQNNTREQAMLGEFDSALDDAVLDSNTAHNEQTMQLMSDPAKMRQFANIIYDVLASKENKSVN
ncbi:MAG TPA: restriction endonuclease subunit R, partial [Acinetobacter nosocomialis]|nr:restriction endonuclease subunit R [Acinetobacter nosocomialis]